MSFQPINIPNCQLWIDSSDYNYMSDESSLQSLNNKGSLDVSINQPNLENQPILKKNALKNLPSILFTGEQFYNLGDVLNIGSSGLTIFIYCKFYENDNSSIIINKSPQTTDNGRYQIGKSSDNKLDFSTQIDSFRSYKNGEIIPNTHMSISAKMQRDFGNIIYINGERVGEIGFENTLNYTNNSPLIIGSANESIVSNEYILSSPFIGELFEILIYNRDLDEEERLGVERYFFKKYTVLQKHLIKSLNKIYTLSDSNDWLDLDVAETPTKLDFENNGIYNNELYNITEECWSKLNKPLSILTYVDNNDFDSIIINNTCRKYDSKFLEVETDPFIPLEKIKNNSKILTWTKSDKPPIITHNILVDQKIKYLLSVDNINYYTFKDNEWLNVDISNIIELGMSKSEIENLSQSDLQLLTGDDIYNKSLHIICGIYDENPEEPATIRKINVNYMENKAPLIINPSIMNDVIHNEYATVSGILRDLEGDKIKYRVLIKKFGEEDFYIADDWVDVVNGFNFIRAYNYKYFNVGTNIIRIETVDQRGEESYWEGNLVLTNQIPLINYTYNPFGFSATISDPDNDEISIQISVNNEIVLPYTEYMNTPKLFKYEWNNKLIKYGRENTIKIEIKDNFGGYIEEEFNIIGEYKNILFLDENGYIYSTESGKPIMTLDLGELITGDNSEPIKITIKNNTNYTLNNIKIYSESENYIPENIKIYIKDREDSIINKEILELAEIMSHGDEKDIYVSVHTNDGHGMEKNNINLIAEGKIILE